MLRRNVKRFRGGLVYKAHRLLHHSTLGSRVIKKKKWGKAPEALALRIKLLERLGDKHVLLPLLFQL